MDVHTYECTFENHVKILMCTCVCVYCIHIDGCSKNN